MTIIGGEGRGGEDRRTKLTPKAMINDYMQSLLKQPFCLSVIISRFQFVYSLQ